MVSLWARITIILLAGTQETLSQNTQRTDSQNEQDRGSAAETGWSVTNDDTLVLLTGSLLAPVKKPVGAQPRYVCYK